MFLLFHYFTSHGVENYFNRLWGTGISDANFSIQSYFVAYLTFRTSHIKEIKETDGKEQGKGSSQLAVNVGCSKASSIKSSSSAQGKRDTCIPADRFTTKSTHRRGGKKSSKSSSDTEIMKLNQPLLPNYICPSSEEKSREARIRHWLCESTFTCADRQVPLVF